MARYLSLLVWAKQEPNEPASFIYLNMFLDINFANRDILNTPYPINNGQESPICMQEIHLVKK